MNHSIFYSRKLRMLLIIPNMGMGIQMLDRDITIKPTLFLQDILKANDSFKEIKGKFDV